MLFEICMTRSYAAWEAAWAMVETAIADEARAFSSPSRDTPAGAGPGNEDRKGGSVGDFLGAMIFEPETEGGEGRGGMYRGWQSVSNTISGSDHGRNRFLR
jgi:hypothetical protein